MRASWFSADFAFLFQHHLVWTLSIDNIIAMSDINVHIAIKKYMDMDTNMDTDIGAETEIGIDKDRALTKLC